MADQNLCGRCGKNPKQGKHRWCSACRSDYRTDNKGKQSTLARGQAFREGVEAMRKTLADEFRRFGFTTIAAFEVAEAIKRAPGPRFEQIHQQNQTP